MTWQLAGAVKLEAALGQREEQDALWVNGELKELSAGVWGSRREEGAA